MNWNRLINGMLVVATVSVAALAVKKEFGRGKASTSLPDRELDSAKWQSIRQGGALLSPSRLTSEGVTMVIFGDFECPACRQFALRVLPSIQHKYGRVLTVRFRQWPLSYHKFALPMAVAAVCADRQGRFREFHDLAYLQQDSIGIKEISAFGRESGVPDVREFEQCQEGNEAKARVSEDMALAKHIGGTGTPTIVINGTLLRSVPDSASLEALLDAFAQSASRAGR